MTKYYQIGGERVGFQASYLSGTAVSCGGTTVALTVPTGATTAFIMAETAAVYYAINEDTAGTTSPGYVPTDGKGFVFTCDNLAKLAVAGASGAIAHVEFYQE
jgi:hypothetical protein